MSPIELFWTAKKGPEVVLDEEGGVELAHSHVIIHCNEGHIDINHHFQQ